MHQLLPKRRLWIKVKGIRSSRHCRGLRVVSNEGQIRNDRSVIGVDAGGDRGSKVGNSVSLVNSLRDIPFATP
jgi:hypothetical protein